MEEHVHRGGHVGVGCHLRLEPSPSAPQRDHEDHQHAEEQERAPALDPHEVVEGERVDAERLDDLLAQLLALRRSRQQLPQRDALHLEELVGLEPVGAGQARQGVGDPQAHRGYLVLGGQQLVQLGPGPARCAGDGSTQGPDPRQERRRDLILPGLRLRRRPGQVHALELLAVRKRRPHRRLEIGIPRGEGQVGADQRGPEVGEVPVGDQGLLGGERVDLADDRREPGVDVVDQRALLRLLADLPNRPVRLLGGAEDLWHRDGSEATPVDRLAARRTRRRGDRRAHGRLEQREQQDGPHGRPETTPRRGRRHLHRGSGPGQGVQPPSDPMTRTPLSEGGTASPSRFTQVTWNPCASAPSASKGEPAT